MDYIPSFCTACYREGRTGRPLYVVFARAARSRTAASRTPCSRWESCLCDYASPAVAEKGWKMIDTELARVPDDRRRALAADYLARVRTGG